MSMQADDLQLRDVHVPPAPSWWPLAPGWWLVIGGVLLLLVIVFFLQWRRARRRRDWLHWFDSACMQAGAPARIAAISELLRRAARRADRGSERLQGNAWLEFLDGRQGRAFSQGAGQLLLEGAYRRDVDATAVAELERLARARFLELMERRR